MAGKRRVVADISFGPYFTKPNAVGSSSAASGVIIDIFPSSGSAMDYAVGGGVQTTATGRDGIARLIFNQIVPTNNYFYYRASFPPGLYDTDRPGFAMEIIDILKI